MHRPLVLALSLSLIGCATTPPVVPAPAPTTPLATASQPPVARQSKWDRRDNHEGNLQPRHAHDCRGATVLQVFS